MSIDISPQDFSAANRCKLNEDGTVDVKSLSFSAVEMYLRCGEQFRRRYIEGEKQPPGIALTEGISHHKAMELDNLEKFEKGKQLSASKLTEIFSETFKTTVAEHTKECDELKTKLEWNDETPKGLHLRAQKWHKQYASEFSPKLNPADKPEAQFSKEFEINGIGARLHGAVDVYTKDEVIDYKTSKNAKSQGEVDNSLQLSLYSWAKSKKKVAYIAFVKAADPYVQKIGTVRKPGDILWALDVVASVVDSIRRGSFHKVNPGAFPPPWWCSERFCGFWKTCRGKYAQ